ncbi:cobalt-precorrin-5B (C(1))-methyltransferase CbiD [Azotosporobacter soli]|uniref:cobalt-precorrin-5B (C(1))-methyltransferase CbiD n=1 Tax=Azotosporobacter soli TaxID=3055040 RepID=UPI0031FEE843
MKEKLRSGITTGTCATAAAQAAILAVLAQTPEAVCVRLPRGEDKIVALEYATRITENTATAGVRKDAGDDPDITNGILVVADVELTQAVEIRLLGGEGVGVVTKPGLSILVGEAAINPVPRRMIEEGVRSIIGPARGAVIRISIPGGEKLARRTLNPSLGIEGGLSVIGTTGIVEPMSEEAFKDSLTPQIDVALAQGFESLVFVPGKIGENIAVDQYGLPKEAVLQTSNFIGHMLTAAEDKGVKRVLLFGHPGKLVKVAGGIFHTHNRMADGRMEIIAAYAALQQAGVEIIEEILACTTTEAATDILRRQGLNEAVYAALAKQASNRAQRYVFGGLEIGTVIVSMQGEILGMDECAKAIGGTLQWNIR